MSAPRRTPRPAEPGPRRAPRGQKPRRDRSDLAQRVVVAVPAAILAILMVAGPRETFALGVLALGLVCLHELFRMFDEVQPAKLAGFAGLVALVAAAHFGDGERQVLLALVACVPGVYLVGVLMPGRRWVSISTSITLLGLVWVGLAVAHAVLLRDLPHGAGILISILVGTFLGDTGAYLGGRAFGTRKLAPSVSPNKTVEGLVVGMLVAVFAVWAAGLYQDWLSGGQALLLGLVVAVFAPLGDLFESQLKRDADTKDAGGLFGVHGGALDRLDAALFAIVAGYYVWLAML